jgi:hypothetical protein
LSLPTPTGTIVKYRSRRACASLRSAACRSNSSATSGATIDRIRSPTRVNYSGSNSAHSSTRLGRRLLPDIHAHRTGDLEHRPGHHIGLIQIHPAISDRITHHCRGPCARSNAATNSASDMAHGRTADNATNRSSA